MLLGYQSHSIDVGDLRLLKDFSIRDSVIQVNAEDGTKTALVEPFGESYSPYSGDWGQQNALLPFCQRVLDLLLHL